MRRSILLWLFIFAGCLPKPDTFDDHSLPRLATLADYQRFAVTSNGRSEAKFVITSFGSDAAALRYTDSHFFSLHDEWYWFRLLNGQHVPGREGLEPVAGHHFETIADIYTWAKAQTAPLPLDLTWVDDGRLYSPRFYTLALDLTPRAFGLGTLVHVTARGTRPERWAFQLEFTDRVSHDELVKFFEQVDATVPPGAVGPGVLGGALSEAGDAGPGHGAAAAALPRAHPAHEGPRGDRRDRGLQRRPHRRPAARHPLGGIVRGHQLHRPARAGGRARLPPARRRGAHLGAADAAGPFQPAGAQPRHPQRLRGRGAGQPGVDRPGATAAAGGDEGHRAGSS